MSHGVYRVERRVDTVVLEMDIDVAEKLLEVLGQVNDQTTDWYSSIVELRNKMEEGARVRTPSALYIAETERGDLLLRRTTGGEMEIRRAARNAM